MMVFGNKTHDWRWCLISTFSFDTHIGSLVYMMDKNGNKLQYTAPQRKRESKAKTNQRILLEERKRNGIIEKETILSLQNSKSVDYEKFKTFLVEKDKLNKETTEFYKRDTW